MTLRTARILVAAGAFVAGLVLCLAVVLLVSGREGVPSMPQVASIGGPFSLTDQNGRTVTEQDLKGKPVLVFFGYTN
jgi:protein SCO1/2